MTQDGGTTERRRAAFFASPKCARTSSPGWPMGRAGEVTTPRPSLLPQGSPKRRKIKPFE
jgi:hypothetical protein